MLNSFKLFKHQLDYVMCEDKYPFMIGGVGSGKTTAFCIFALNQCAKNAGFGVCLDMVTGNYTLWRNFRTRGGGKLSPNLEFLDKMFKNTRFEACRNMVTAKYNY